MHVFVNVDKEKLCSLILPRENYSVSLSHSVFLKRNSVLCLELFLAEEIAPEGLIAVRGALSAQERQREWDITDSAWARKKKNPANSSSKCACKLCCRPAGWVSKGAGGPGWVTSHARIWSNRLAGKLKRLMHDTDFNVFRSDPGKGNRTTHLNINAGILPCAFPLFYNINTGPEIAKHLCKHDV